MKDYKIIEHYLYNLKYHFEMEELGDLKYKIKKGERDKVEINYKQYVSKRSNDVLWLNYGVFILILDDYYFKITFRSYGLTIYLLWTLQKAIDRLL